MSVEPTLETTRFPLTTAPHMTSIVFMPLPFTPTHWRGSTAYSGNLSTPSNDAIAKGVANNDTLQLLSIVPFRQLWKPVGGVFLGAGVLIGVGGSLSAIRRFLQV